MDITELAADAFTRVRDAVRRATSNLSAEALTFRPDAEANSIAWLVWHLSRIQDDHVAKLAGREQTFPTTSTPSSTSRGIRPSRWACA